MDRRRVSVGPLGPEDARTLALSLLGSHAVTLEKMVSDRLSRLDGVGRRLLELVAVGGRPLEISLVGKAAGLQGETEEVVSQLRARRFVRIELRGGRELIEISHGRIAEAIMAPLTSEAIREHHACLALVLEDSPGTDAEALALHLLGAGQEVRAAEWAERAADDASNKLAFEKAARLFRLAIATRESSDPAFSALPRLRMRLGAADARLSSAELEGPLKQQVDELLRMEKEIDLTEQMLRKVREEASAGSQPAADLRARIADLEETLAVSRARFQEAVLDLPLDAPPPEPLGPSEPSSA
jgi:hypothetical protein